MKHHEIIIIKSKKGQKKLLHEGFAYTKHKISNNTTYWRCGNRKCKGFIMTKSENSVVISNEHDIHEKDYDKTEAHYIKHLIKERAINANEKPRDIIDAELKIGSQLLLKNLPQLKNIRDGITRIRKNNNIEIIKDDLPENIIYMPTNCFYNLIVALMIRKDLLFSLLILIY
ncbi:hypothetical protein DMUE_1801 [Dictyocoela muelleri]|nr:hypothetical protein DMUE_1801 [Dictyocoela muelleri]